MSLLTRLLKVLPDVIKGDELVVYHYLPGPLLTPYSVNATSEPFINENADWEVGIKFRNGDKSYAVFNEEFERWEVGEGEGF